MNLTRKKSRRLIETITGQKNLHYASHAYALITGILQTSSSGTSINRTGNRQATDSSVAFTSGHSLDHTLDQRQSKNSTTANDSYSHYSLLRCLMQSSTRCLNTWHCCPETSAATVCYDQPYAPTARRLHHRAARKKRDLLLRA